MSFTTEVQIPEFPWKIDYSKKIMFVGSCFTENVGQRFIDLKFSTDLNPFGVLYNPHSIANSLKILLDKQKFFEFDLFQDQGLWNSFYHHSSFSDIDLDITLEKINSQIVSSHEFLKTADFLILTFGTAWAYQLENNKQVVSNCHKVPASHFNRIRFSVHEIVEAYQHLLEELWVFNPNLKIIFTVSPIRHWKDGAVGNQTSKAILILAIDHLMKIFASRECAYFPAYELVMDELRDYRYYAADMIHLSEVAIDYIFERFQSVLISQESSICLKAIERIRKAMQHRPFNVNSPEYLKFVKANIQEIEKLLFNFPNINFGEELAHFEKERAMLM
jgi:hypothetical protein